MKKRLQSTPTSNVEEWTAKGCCSPSGIVSSPFRSLFDHDSMQRARLDGLLDV